MDFFWAFAWSHSSAKTSLAEMNVFGNHFVLMFLDPKQPKMGPKLSVSSFMKNSCMWHFWFFCIEFQKHEGLQLTEMIFMEKILSWVKILLLGKKWPKISFLSFITKSWIEFLSIFGFWKLGRVIFTKFLFGGLWDYNALKWLQNDDF